MSDLAKDVAKELDRRRFRRRLIVIAVWLAAVIAALYYVRCGRGSGGGEGPQAGTGSGTGSGAAMKRCAVRVTAQGITVDGKSVNRETAAAICKQAGGAEVVVTGDAREGDWAALRGALSAANVDILLHEAR